MVCDCSIERHRESTWGLIQRAAEGDEEARERLAMAYEAVIRNYFERLWRGLLRIQDVDDAVQDTFVDLFHGALSRVDPDKGSFRQFLFGVVRNIAARYGREVAKMRANPADPLVLDRIESREPSASRIYDVAVALALINTAWRLWRRAASSKSQLLRVRIIEDRFREEMGVTEIARRDDARPKTYDYHYRRALKELLKSLRQVIREDRPGSILDDEIDDILGLLG
jgi:RNA polymerase sigma factor (sigma-70 family)